MPWGYGLFTAICDAQDAFRSAVYESDPATWSTEPCYDGPDELHPLSKRMMEMCDEMEELRAQAQALCEEQAGLPFRAIQHQLFCDDFEGRVRLVAYHGYRFTGEERMEVIVETVHAGKGEYKEDELRAMDDDELARTLLHAWHTYVQLNVL